MNGDRNTELTQIVHDFAVRLSDEGLAPDNQILTDHADCSTCQWVFYHKSQALEALDHLCGCGYRVLVSDDRKVYIPVRDDYRIRAHAGRVGQGSSEPGVHG